MRPVWLICIENRALSLMHQQRNKTSRDRAASLSSRPRRTKIRWARISSSYCLTPGTECWNSGLADLLDEVFNLLLDVDQFRFESRNPGPKLFNRFRLLTGFG